MTHDSQLHTQEIEYQHDATGLRAFCTWSLDGAGPRPAVLVAHAWGGRDRFATEKAEQLARLGYVGFALDMFGAGRLGSGPEENAGLIAPFINDRRRLRARMTAALETVRGLPAVDVARIAAIGFCFGGLCVLDLARSGADLRGVVAFHGLLGSAEGLASGPVRARVLALHGYDDPMATPAQLTAFCSEMTSAGADWQVHAYGNTVHAFTNPAAGNATAGTVYSPLADRRSWLAMRSFLEEALA